MRVVPDIHKEKWSGPKKRTQGGSRAWSQKPGPGMHGKVKHSNYQRKQGGSRSWSNSGGSPSFTTTAVVATTPHRRKSKTRKP